VNILIIEDDLFLARNIKKIFEKKIITNRIKIISDYKQFARELSVINSYDIILVDMMIYLI
jgi:DNA-binding response OmpR family regulator